MYQLEVKRWLISNHFQPKEGWKVQVDIDAMERAKGSQHKPGKAARVHAAEDALVKLGVTIGPHHKFGRADIVAEHPTKGLFIVEVEGTSSRQKEQAIYSALGQLVLQMQGQGHKFVIAVPDTPPWEAQVKKIPTYVRTTLDLLCLLVSENGVRET